jgi:hypothetical protein
MSITIKRSSPEGNVHVVLAYLQQYRKAMQRKRIKTPRIDTFLDDCAWKDMEYDDICKKVEELSHGYIRVS